MIGGWIGFLTFLFAFRYVSLGSLAAAVGVPTGMAVQMHREGRWDYVLLGFGIVVMILAFVRHRSNIQRLLAGTESKAFTKKRPQA
jgi:glycerol-3-phosphate acyltransferase PlsY